MRSPLLRAVFLIVCAFYASAAGKPEMPLPDANRRQPPLSEAGTEDHLPAAPASSPQAELSRAEQVMRALSAAYPRRVGEAVFRDGDWAVPLRGQWFYYAEGRLLPEALRSKSAEFSPQPFYPYPQVLPAWKKPSREAAARLSEAVKRRQSGQSPARSQFFYDALWQAGTRAEAWDRQKTIRFLGKSVMVHHGIMEELALVEQRINDMAKQDEKVRSWLAELNSITAWNWRTIADVQTRSNHAYGIAVDLLPAPKIYRARDTYWLWTARNTGEWWNVPYTRRYHPPDAVIRAFEDYGFVWGGKWAFYDTMHFEYRPEILILNGIDISGEY